MRRAPSVVAPAAEAAACHEAAPRGVRLTHLGSSTGEVTWGHGGKDVPEERKVQISKALTKVLRHTARELGLKVRPDGFVALGAVLASRTLRRMAPEMSEVEYVVQHSDKQRFSVAHVDGALHIRANQGHSMKEVNDEVLLKRLLPGAPDLPATVVHGTYLTHWPDILEKGLLAGGRRGTKEFE